MKKYDTIGPWILLKKLGEGANAEVWAARRDDNELPIALKILKATLAASEPFRRFAAEARMLSNYRPPGLLPIIDTHLPDNLQQGDRAWIAMPIAERIDKALGRNPALPDVVNAIADVAEILAGVGSLGISHRDIKPSNLYQYEDRFVPGDWGLVDYPGKEEITVGDRQVGPRGYIAPEMISDPVGADGRLADVYSLAKTLFVLATSSKHPPLGELRRDSNQLRLSAFVHHDRDYILDELLEKATFTSPLDRPNMARFAKELRVFLSGEPTGPEDVRDLGKRLRSAVAKVEARVRDSTDPLNFANLYRFPTALQPIARAIQDAGLGDGEILEVDHLLNYGHRDRLNQGLAVEEDRWSAARGFQVEANRSPVFRMLTGLGLEIDDDRNAFIVAAHGINEGADVRAKSRTISGRLLWWAARKVDPEDDDEVDLAIQELSALLLENLRLSLEKFCELVEEYAKTGKR